MLATKKGNLYRMDEDPRIRHDPTLRDSEGNTVLMLALQYTKDLYKQYALPGYILTQTNEITKVLPSILAVWGHDPSLRRLNGDCVGDIVLASSSKHRTWINPALESVL